MLQFSRFHRTIRVHDIHIVLDNDGFQIVELRVVFVFRPTNGHRRPDLQEKGPVLVLFTPLIIRDVDRCAVGVGRLHLTRSTHSHLGIEQRQADDDLLYALHSAEEFVPSMK